MKLLFLVLVIGICANTCAVAQVVQQSANSTNKESNGRIPLPSKAGMFGIENENKSTTGAPPSTPSFGNSKKEEGSKQSPNSPPSNEKLAKLVRDQTHAINLLFIELNSIKERMDTIEAERD